MKRRERDAEAEMLDADDHRLGDDPDVFEHKYLLSPAWQDFIADEELDK